MNWLEILKRAMKLEQKGREFYLRAATMLDDAEAVKMFRRLADDELDHYNFLQREYAEVLCNDTWCDIPDLEGVESPDVEKPIFPQDREALNDTLPDDASLEEVLLFALDAEDKTVKLYKESAEQVEDPQAQEFFSRLAEVERGHFSTVLQRYESYYHYPR
jgi:rubrerythrin